MTVLHVCMASRRGVIGTINSESSDRNMIFDLNYECPAALYVCIVSIRVRTRKSGLSGRLWETFPLDNTRLATGPAKIQGLGIIGLANIQLQGLRIIGAD